MKKCIFILFFSILLTKTFGQINQDLEEAFGGHKKTVSFFDNLHNNSNNSNSNNNQSSNSFYKYLPSEYLTNHTFKSSDGIMFKYINGKIILSSLNAKTEFIKVEVLYSGKIKAIYIGDGRTFIFNLDVTNSTVTDCHGKTYYAI